jgi:hypothetical protein
MHRLLISVRARRDRLTPDTTDFFQMNTMPFVASQPMTASRVAGLNLNDCITLANGLYLDHRDPKAISDSDLFVIALRHAGKALKAIRKKSLSVSRTTSPRHSCSRQPLRDARASISRKSSGSHIRANVRTVISRRAHAIGPNDRNIGRCAAPFAECRRRQ